jgi:hypothetical protein
MAPRSVGDPVSAESCQWPTFPAAAEDLGGTEQCPLQGTFWKTEQKEEGKDYPAPY